MPKRPKAPPDLTPASRRLFQKLVDEYDITDSGGVAILTSGLTSLDRAVAAEAQIAAEGVTSLDRFGQRKAHPLCPVARDNRAAWVAALKALNLAVGTPARPGRPEGA